MNLNHDNSLVIIAVLIKSRYGKARFEKFIVDCHRQPFHQQLEFLKDSFMEVRGSLEQTDDITVVGLEFK